MRFCCRTGSTPRHPDTLSLFRYQYKDDTAVSRWPRHFHDEALSVSSLDQRNLERRRSYAFSTTIRSVDIQNPTPRRSPHLPKTEHYPWRSNAADAEGIRLQAEALLGSVSGVVGLREYPESNGHILVVTADKDGPGSVFERELPQSWWFGDFGPTTFSLLHTL
jgi:hypothetical protein